MTTTSESLQLIAEATPHPEWQALLYHLQRQIQQGSSFSQALAQWPGIFPPLYPAVVSVGELTGYLEDCCQRLAQQQERHQRLQHNIRRALRYPVFTLVIALIVSLGMLTWVLPEFETIYTSFNAPLPLFTRWIMQMSHFLTQHGLIFLMAVSGIGYGCRITHQRSLIFQRYIQRQLLKIPLLGKVVHFSQLNVIFSTLTLTQQAGLTLPDSLQATEKVIGGRLWQETLTALCTHIINGNLLNTILLQHPLFPPLCHQMIKAGEASGSLDTVMKKLADIYYDEAQQRAEQALSLLEPAMMLLVATIVGSLVIAMYLPLFNLGEIMG
ncbi:MAG: Type II secretion system protein F [Candidatus Erwinia impunctatus]|nr:Type II secretion system protein F [Culicoides impunctatus]